MHESNRQKIDEFLLSLTKALGESNPQSPSIVEEVHGDLLQHLERHLLDGVPEDEAVERAIDEMGNPFEMAHHIREVVPPFGGKGITLIRYILASALILWTLVMLWFMRAGVYGFSPTLHAIVIFLHLPAILLLWPRLVWRRNFLFGLIPAGLGMVAVFFFALAGTRSEELVLPIDLTDENETVTAPAITHESNDPRKAAVPIAIGLTGFSFVIIFAMQQPAQRRLTLTAILVSAGLVEGIYQAEEFRFRKDRVRIQAHLAEALHAKGKYPTREELATMDLGLQGFWSDGGDYSFFWPRPLSPGYSLVGNSTEEIVRVQD